MRCIVTIGCLAVVLAGCTSIKVRPVDPALAIRHVCIQQNSKVIVEDFLPVIQKGFERYGIASDVYPETAPLPATCENILTYTALQSWDIVTYLSHAELRLESKDHKLLADAVYHLNGKGGLALTKFQGVETKMNPVIDELLRGRRAVASTASATR